VGRPDATGREARADDEFETFFRENYAPLASYLMRMGAGAADAEDIAQVAFIAVHRRWQELVGRVENLRAYLFTIASRLYYRTARAGRRTVVVADEDLSELHGPVADPSSHVEFAVDFQNMLASLPTLQREVMSLRAMDLSYGEIAPIVGMQEPAVRKLAERARATLRKRALPREKDTGT